MIALNGWPITITTFPDKTTQVWKLPEHILRGDNHIVWEYENPGELLDLLQLCLLLGDAYRTLSVPYLPYSRQDKPVGNHNTFAKHMLAKVLGLCGFTYITTVDVHSDEVPIKHLINISPIGRINRLIKEYGINTVIFPDKGAVDRYNVDCRVMFATKKRDPLSGDIIATEFTNHCDIVTPVLVVDDICDGGRTFIELAKVVGLPAQTMYLYVSHGIFSKGVEQLRTYYSRIFTYQGDV